ncbi:hypothetical protein FACS18949_01140 [Clostridia bacterium]|nr:hypothetical protein FACS18949_01140 [Clostridia bacterium]
MPKMLKRIGSLILVAALLSGFLPQDVSPPQVDALAAYRFIDISGHPAAAAIQRWAELGIVSGIHTIDGYKFYPNQKTTRAEFFTFFNHVLGAGVVKGIYQYTDVSPSKWYYLEISKAYAAGLIQGRSETAMAPEEYITRQEVVTVLAKALGMNVQNASDLDDYFNDAGSVSGYARGYVAAFARRGWIKADANKNFRPNDHITRADAMTMLDGLLKYVPSGANYMSNANLSGNLLMRYPGVDIVNMKIDGDVILGDGLQQGNFALRNCTINGRLVIRGGGPNSVNLSGTKITGGIYVYNPNGATRIYNSNSTVRTGVVTARTTTFFEGEGIASVEVPENAVTGAYFLFTDTTMDSLMINKPGTRATVNGGTIDNLLVQPRGEGSSIALNGAGVNFLDIKAQNVTVTGNGTVDTAVIDAPGANIAMQPRLVSIAPGISAIINGKVVNGPDVGGGGSSHPSTVSRGGDAAMAITRDTPLTGGGTLTLKTSAGSAYNQVDITQAAGTTLQLTELRRPAYWIGFFVPVPVNYQNPVIKASYTFESPSSSLQPDAVYSLPVVRQDNTNGVIIYLPAKLDETGTGSLDTVVSFTWGDATYEKIRFKAAGLKVAAPTDLQSRSLAAQFANAVFLAYDALHVYSGSEALRRLLDSDNALGLDLRGLSAYSDVDKQRFLAQMYVDRATLTSKKAIQEYITGRTNFVGALYAVNHAMSAPEMRGILERPDYADQLNIEVGPRSSYGGLSSIGKNTVASEMLLSRKAGYATEALAKAQFDKSVAARQAAEVTLLASINNAVDAAAMQKIMDNKTNGAMLGIGGEPYTSAAAALKRAAAQKVINAKPFTSLDQVIAILSPPEQYLPPKIDPENDPTVSSVVSNPAALRLVIGKSGVLTPVITTPSGNWATATSLQGVKIDVKNSPATSVVVDARAASGTGLVVTGLAKGTATLTLTSTKDAKKKTTVKVDVVDAIPATNIELDQISLDISKGQSRQIRAIVTPANATSELTWHADKQPDENGVMRDIVTVSGVGASCMITGVTAGFTNVVVESESGMRAICKVFVGDEEAKILLEKSEVTIGLECYATINAKMSPVDASVRTLTYRSEAPEIIAIDNPLTGTVKALAVTPADGIKIFINSAAYPNLPPAVFTVKVDETMCGVYLSEKGPVTLYKNGYKKLEVQTVPAERKLTPVWNVVGAENVIKVDDTGRVSAIGPGKAQVVVSLKEDPSATATCDFEVLSTALTVKVTPAEMTKIPLVVGDPTNGTRYITTTMTPTPSNAVVDYYSQDSTIASVDQNGLVTAVKNGSTRIVVRPQANGQEILVDVKVTEIPLTDIDVQPELTLNLNQQQLLPVIFYPSNASNRKLQWMSTDNGTVYVDPNTGMITGVRTTVSSETSIVRDPITGQPVYDILVFPDGSTKTSAEPRMETNTINNPVIVTVTALGLNNPAKAKKAVKVTVLDRETTTVNSVKISLDNWVIPAGSTRQLTAIINEGDVNNMPANRNVVWDSNNTTVATVDTSGRVTALSPGIASITVTTEEGGRTSTVKVVVAPVGVTSMVFNNLEPSTEQGPWVRMALDPVNMAAKQMDWTTGPTGTSNSALNWASSNNNVSVTNGILTANVVGASEISVVPYARLTYGSEQPINLKDDAELMTENVLTRVATTTSAPDDRYVFADGGNLYTLQDPNGHVLELRTQIPLVVRNPLVAAPATFTAVVFKTPPNILTVPMPAQNTLPLNAQTTLQATINPPKSTVDSVTWTVNGVVATSTLNGHTSTLPLTPKTTDDIVLTCTVLMDAYDITLGGKVWHTDKTELVQTYTLHVREDKPTAVNVSFVNLPNEDMYSNYNQPIEMKADITPDTASEKRVEWSVSGDQKGIAEIDKNTGILTILGTPGTVRIRATSVSAPSVYGETELTVKPLNPPKSIELPPDFGLNVGSQTSIAATLFSDMADITELTYTRRDVKWSVDKTGIIEFVKPDDRDTNIDIIGKAPGTVRLTATAWDNAAIYAACEITVAEPATLTSIIPMAAPISLALPIGLRLAEALPDLGNLHNDAQIAEAVYGSDNPDVASVDGSGVITAKVNGEATLSVTYKGNTRTMRVSVDGKEATKLKLRSSARVILGDKITLRPDVTPYDATAYIWTSSDLSVASVSASGEVTGLKVGRSTITLSSADGSLTAKCTVYVSNAPSIRVAKVRLSAKTRTLYKGDSFALEAFVSPSNAPYSGVSWYSSNPAAVRVDSYGNVYALAGGKATITAVTDDGGLVATSVITVRVRVTSVTLSESTLKMEVGEVKKLNAAVLPSDATTNVVAWKSSDSAIAAVSADGRVTAKKEGEVTITARCDGKSVTCKIQVTQKELPK